MKNIKKAFKGTSDLHFKNKINKKNENIDHNIAKSKNGVQKHKKSKTDFKLLKNLKEEINQKNKTKINKNEINISKKLNKNENKLNEVHKIKGEDKDITLQVNEKSEKAQNNVKKNEKLKLLTSNLINEKHEKEKEKENATQKDDTKKVKKEKTVNKESHKNDGNINNKKLNKNKNVKVEESGHEIDHQEKSKKDKNKKSSSTENKELKEENIGKNDFNSPQKNKEKKENKKLKKKTAGKTSTSSQSLENAPSFNEENFNSIVSKENIIKIVKALKQQASEEVSTKKNQIFSDFKYILNVICFKIPLCAKRLVKLKLKHSLVGEEDDVCLFVKDLERGRKFDFEPTVHYYEDLFKEKGIKGIKAIIPFNQLKQEYGSYEMKIKLSNLYDYFLCDGAIIGHVFGFLGKNFQKTRCTLHAVRMNTKNPTREIQKALQKTSYKQGEKGTMISIPVATHKMSPKQIADNILTVITQLKDIYPGGLSNIRNLHLKVNIKGTSSLPLYISMAAPPENVPFVIGPKEQKLRTLKKEANTILSKFSMTQTGALFPKDENLTSSNKRKHEIKISDEIALKKKKKLQNNSEDFNVNDVNDEKDEKPKKSKNEKIEKEKIKEIAEMIIDKPTFKEEPEENIFNNDDIFEEDSSSEEEESTDDSENNIEESNLLNGLEESDDSDEDEDDDDDEDEEDDEDDSNDEDDSEEETDEEDDSD